MGVAAVTPGTIKTGPGIIRYAPLGTALPTFTVTASKLVATWTTWVSVGATDEGITFQESTDTADIEVAESLYPVYVVTTKKTGTCTFNMSQIDTKNWQLASNGGTITTTGATTTKLDTYVPPLVGAEVRVMLGFQSYDDTEAFVWPQTFNTGGFETQRGKFDAKAGLPVSFNVELPDPLVLTTPYKRWTAGALATG